MPTREQIRAARAFLDWTQERLADAASMTPRTVVNFETDKRPTLRSTPERLRQALEQAGMEFTDDGGVRPRARP